MSEPLDLDALEARLVGLPGYTAGVFRALIAELRATRAERDKWQELALRESTVRKLWRQSADAAAGETLREMERAERAEARLTRAEAVIAGIRAVLAAGHDSAYDLRDDILAELVYPIQVNPRGTDG